MNIKSEIQQIERSTSAIRKIRDDLVEEFSTKGSAEFMREWRKFPRLLSEREYGALHTADKADYLFWELRQG